MAISSAETVDRERASADTPAVAALNKNKSVIDQTLSLLSSVRFGLVMLMLLLVCCMIGMLVMHDEAGGDSKILAVPIDKLSSLYRNIKSPSDLPEITTRQIAHFFEHYKDLEPGKWVRVGIWVDAVEAKQEIIDGVARYKASLKPKKTR